MFGDGCGDGCEVTARVHALRCVRERFVIVVCAVRFDSARERGIEALECLTEEGRALEVRSV